MAPTDPMHGLTTAIGERIEHAIFRSESAQLNRRGWGRFSCQQSKQGRLWSNLRQSNRAALTSGEW